MLIFINMNQEEIDNFLAACDSSRVEREKRNIAKTKMNKRIASSTFKKTTTFDKGGGITTLTIVNGAVVYKRFHE